MVHNIPAVFIIYSLANTKYQTIEVTHHRRFMQVRDLHGSTVPFLKHFYDIFEITNNVKYQKRTIPTTQ